RPHRQPRPAGFRVPDHSDANRPRARTDARRARSRARPIRRLRLLRARQQPLPRSHALGATHRSAHLARGHTRLLAWPGQGRGPRVKIVFGTDGWRARIAEEYTFDAVRVCAQAVAEWVQKSGEADRGVIIGYDRRFASEHFAAAAAEVVAAHGIHVFLSTAA